MAAQVKVDKIYNTSNALQQEFVRLKPKHEHEREATLLSLASRTFTSRAIVFFAAKKSAHRAKILFGLAGLQVASPRQPRLSRGPRHGPDAMDLRPMSL